MFHQDWNLGEESFLLWPSGQDFFSMQPRITTAEYIRDLAAALAKIPKATA